MAFAASCDSAKSPPAPETGTGTATEKDSSTKKPVDKLGNDDTDTSTEVATGTTFNYGGAKVGDDADQADVTKCHSDGKIYDRFASDGAKCSDLTIAAVDCTKEGLEDKLSDAQKTDFESKLSGTYDGWMLDQCADCPADGTNELCKSTQGSKQTGTKVFFVKEESDTVTGKAMVLPVSYGPGPAQAGGDSSTSTGTANKSSGTETGTSSGTGSGTGTAP